MVKKFKAHPLMIFTFLKPFLFVLVIPLISGLIQYSRNKTIDNLLAMEILLFTVIMFIAILRWQSFSFICDSAKNTVIIKSGLLFVKRSKIQISMLSSIQTAKNPIDAVFGAVTYRINTEAGTTGRSDYEFKLSNKQSATVSAMLYGKNECEPIRFSAFKVAVLAATTSSAFTGIIIGVPLINMAGKLLGVAISDMLLNEINNASSKIKTYFPPVVNVISLILLLAYLLSVVYSFLQYINFKLFLQDDKLEVRSGFFVRRRTSFKKKAINDLRIEQSPIMILLRRFAMKVSVGGYGDTKNESEVIIPLGTNYEMKKRFSRYLPFGWSSKKGIRPKHSFWMKSRFLSWPAYYLIGVAVIAIILSLRFEDFTRFIFFLTCVAGGIIICYAYLCLYEYNHGAAKFGENIFMRSNRGFRTCELYCHREKVGEVKITRFPPDYIYKTCRVRVLVRSERADSLRVRHLDYETVKNEVFKCFEIEE